MCILGPKFKNPLFLRNFEFWPQNGPRAKNQKKMQVAKTTYNCQIK